MATTQTVSPPRSGPIIMSASSVLGILARTKTVTRRLKSPRWLKTKAGDRLWVRECYLLDERNAKGRVPQEVVYDATPEWALDHTGALHRVRFITGETVSPEEARRSIDTNTYWHRKSPLYMPYWASRISLEVTEDARVELLRSITEADAVEEGVSASPDFTATMNYAVMWNSLHARDAPWESNPEVVRIAFRRVAAMQLSGHGQEVPLLGHCKRQLSQLEEAEELLCATKRQASVTWPEALLNGKKTGIFWRNHQ
jgi:hypothetical protein